MDNIAEGIMLRVYIYLSIMQVTGQPYLAGLLTHSAEHYYTHVEARAMIKIRKYVHTTRLFPQMW